MRSPGDGFWPGKRVLVTGHTGFKGAWLCLWLRDLGADVHGLALPPDPARPSLHRLINGDVGSDEVADVREHGAVRARVLAVRPEIVLHLAAQPLVRASYRCPLDTFATNVQGTANLLESLREVPSVRSVVSVTTDKVYENLERSEPFVETDPLGGHDPYSASKAAADILTASYRRSFFLPRGVGLASARAGNVIGGGDWAEDRLIPDAIRAFEHGGVLEVRRPDAVRPWQHVLEPLHGYLLLAERLWHEPGLAPSYNFGPERDSAATVRHLLLRSGEHVDLARIRWGDGDEGPHEAGFLQLDSTNAARDLGFRSRFGLAETIDRTWRWYDGFASGSEPATLCRADIAAFEANASTP